MKNLLKLYEEILLYVDTTTLLIVLIFFVILEYRPPWWRARFPVVKCTSSSVQPATIPGPYALPLLGTRWMFGTFGSYNFGQIHEFYRDMYVKYGPVMKEEAFCNVPVISLFEKSDIEKVLRSNSKYPLRPPVEALTVYRKSRPDRYASIGLVNEQGEAWHTLRTSLTPVLTSPRTISNFMPQLDQIADDWCNLLKQLRNSDNEVFNMKQLGDRLGLEITCALVLGRRMGFLLPDGESDVSKRFATAINNHFLATRDTYFGLPLWRYISTASYAKLVESEEIIYELAMELIRTADDSTKDSDVFQSVLKADIDDREKTAAIIDFLAAGIHTLKNTIIFVLYLIAQNSHAQDTILKDENSMAYVKACVNESFRLYPTANSLARIIEEDIELGGYRVKAGNVIVCHTYIACRDERNFKKANEFRPERWLNEEKSETLSNATYLLTPFGSGRRICPGKRFIEHILPIIVESTVKHFDISVNKPLELEFEFLLGPKGPISMIFKDRF